MFFVFFQQKERMNERKKTKKNTVFRNKQRAHPIVTLLHTFLFVLCLFLAGSMAARRKRKQSEANKYNLIEWFDVRKQQQIKLKIEMYIMLRCSILSFCFFLLLSNELKKHGKTNNK